MKPIFEMIFVRLTLCNLVNFLLNVLYHCLDSKVDKDLTTITSSFKTAAFCVILYGVKIALMILQLYE